jgi:hypothetical protein
MNEAKTKVLCEKVMGWVRIKLSPEEPDEGGWWFTGEGYVLYGSTDFTTSADCDALVEAFALKREHFRALIIDVNRSRVILSWWKDAVAYTSGEAEEIVVPYEFPYTTSAKNLAVCEAIYSAVTGGEG